MAYEIIDRETLRAPAGEPMLSFQQNGTMRFNSEATRILKDNGAPGYVLLMWDSAKKKVAAKVLSDKDSRAYSLSYSSVKGFAQFKARAFASRIGWNAQSTVRVPVRWTDGMFEGVIPAEYLAGEAARPRRTPKKKPEP
jgi:hypothetical protein